MPMVAPSAATTSIYRKGRKFIFRMLPPAEVYLEGLIDLAAKRGLKTVALINVDDTFCQAAQGAIELAKKKGLQVVFVEAYPQGNDRLLRDPHQGPGRESRCAGGGATRFEDAVAITRQLKTLNVNPRMFAADRGRGPLKFYEALGRDAEFVYGLTAVGGRAGRASGPAA